MCGIAGVFIFNQEANCKLDLISEAIKKLHLRGPDCNAVIKKETYALAHARLAIIDTSAAANQPFTDESGRYTIVFNGEIFNFQSIKKSLQSKGFTFITESDTEVLLKLYIDEGHQCLSKLNGFFSFAIVDNTTHELFIARDRYGIKPLLYSLQDNFFCFASEMKALLQFQLPKKLNHVAMMQYFHLNYIAGNHSILEGVHKIPTGHYAILKGSELTIRRYYQISTTESNKSIDYNFQESCAQLHSLLDDAVRLRMIADVPLGAFLSGGIDSSIVTALAAKHTNNLNTFSIGFKDEPHFDETKYANMVAKKCGTNHTVFSLSNNDLFEHLNDVLSYIDEPFADSSALNVYILSNRTRKAVTVALSGDGADEMFAGYNKHAAAYAVMNNQYGVKQMRYFSALFKALPQSRNTSIGNLVRQLNKLTHGANLSDEERYWLWAGFYNHSEIHQLFNKNLISPNEKQQYESEKKILLSEFKNDKRTEIEKVLLTDMKIVLAGDMLTKVDAMSMANSLEVRVPFLDYRVVDFAFNLPHHFKINSKNRKIILKEAFKNELPYEIFNRSKKGFEVPLLKWFQTDLKSLIVDDLLSEKWIQDQGIFNYNHIRMLLNSLFSNNPGDAVAKIWALIVFQNWYKKYYLN
jgi:asparagine synthase (glutamine-hydrolysing)